MSDHVSNLTCHIGYRLRQLSNYVSHSFARKLASKGITVAEWALMRMLYNEKPTPSGMIAKSMGMTKGAITKLADRLIDKKLVVRETDSMDGRVQILSLTFKASSIIPELAAIADQNDAECFSHLSEQNRKFLQQILEDTVKQLGITSVAIN